MKRIYLAGLITIMLLISSVAARAQDNPITVSFSDSSRPGTLRVHLMSGNLTVKAHSGKDVILQTRVRNDRRSSNRRNDSESSGLRRLDIVTSGLSVEEENNVMTVSSNRQSNLDIDLQVPTRTNLKLTIINGDDIVVQGIDGDIEVTNQNGDVALTDVAGTVVAHSSNGKVVATLKRVTAQKPMSFTSLNGNVDVTLPSDTKANLKLRTENGDVWTDFDVQIKPSPAPTIDDSRKNGGRIRIQVDKSVLGTINGGGPDFDLRSLNGNLYIRKAK